MTNQIDVGDSSAFALAVSNLRRKGGREISHRESDSNLYYLGSILLVAFIVLASRRYSWAIALMNFLCKLLGLAGIFLEKGVYCILDRCRK